MSKHWTEALHPRDRDGQFGHGHGGGVKVSTRDRSGRKVSAEVELDDIDGVGLDAKSLARQQAAQKQEVRSRITKAEKSLAALDRNYPEKNEQQQRLRQRYVAELDALKEYETLVYDRPAGKQPTGAQLRRINELARRLFDDQRAW